MRYYSLEPFEYKLADFELQPIQIKVFTNNNNFEWVSIGQFKEGTNDLHGIGIKVYEYGDTLGYLYFCSIEEGYWKNGQLHGQARYTNKFNTVVSVAKSIIIHSLYYYLHFQNSLNFLSTRSPVFFI